MVERLSGVAYIYLSNSLVASLWAVEMLGLLSLSVKIIFSLSY